MILEPEHLICLAEFDGGDQVAICIEFRLNGENYRHAVRLGDISKSISLRELRDSARKLVEWKHDKLKEILFR